MKKILSFVLAFFALTAFAVDYPYETFPNDPAQARRYTLPNGLTVYMSRNAEKPEIQTMIAVRAGGQNDPLNSTGLAHYLEHLMFKGTRSYGTTDYEKEVPLLRQIDDLYEQYGQTTDPEKRAAIYHLIDSVSYLNSKIAVANEFDKLMSLIGATGVNAYTSDATTAPATTKLSLQANCAVGLSSSPTASRIWLFAASTPNWRLYMKSSTCIAPWIATR